MDKCHSYLAQAWKSYTQGSDRYGVESPEAELIWWAFEEMEQLIDHNPQDAFEVILEILRITDEEKVLFNLAAGPLESILVKHGKEVIDSIAELAKNNPKFRDLLQGVWGNSIDEMVWKQIERLYEHD